MKTFCPTRLPTCTLLKRDCGMGRFHHHIRGQLAGEGFLGRCRSMQEHRDRWRNAVHRAQLNNRQRSFSACIARRMHSRSWSLSCCQNDGGVFQLQWLSPRLLIFCNPLLHERFQHLFVRIQGRWLHAQKNGHLPTNILHRVLAEVGIGHHRRHCRCHLIMDCMIHRRQFCNLCTKNIMKVMLWAIDIINYYYKPLPCGYHLCLFRFLWAQVGSKHRVINHENRIDHYRSSLGPNLC